MNDLTKRANEKLAEWKSEGRKNKTFNDAVAYVRNVDELIKDRRKANRNYNEATETPEAKPITNRDELHERAKELLTEWENQGITGKTYKDAIIYIYENESIQDFAEYSSEVTEPTISGDELHQRAMKVLGDWIKQGLTDKTYKDALNYLRNHEINKDELNKSRKQKEQGM